MIGDAVIAYAGGEKGLLAYRAATGEPLWSASTGHDGYSSPQWITIGGESQVLAFDDAGIVAVDPATGAVRWRHEAAAPHMWRTVQPHLIGDRQILFGSEDLGLVSLDLKQAQSAWAASKRWATNKLKPAYDDFVVSDGSIFGFDGAMFCCLDAETGQRRWKAGRYGHGQVLLLADQKLLLVMAESGEVVLLAANREKLEEFGRFQALEQKTWNDPAVAHGRLYVRNDQEMACFELLPPAQ